MKFMIGYQPRRDRSLLDAIEKNAAHITEVYFSWGDLPNGRGAGGTVSFSEKELSEKMLRELKDIRKCGVDLNLLLNGNCYGKDAQSKPFFYTLGDTIDYLTDQLGLVSVTTTSPLIARFVKENFPTVTVRASVNMSIGTVEGMEYVADLFDSFYLQREQNRNIACVERLRDWCHERGKTLFGLANSGCLNHCSAHTFHDNLVSHEREIARMDNAYVFEGQCAAYLQDAVKRQEWLRLTNFIRPEDVHLYEGLFDGMKLATRVNSNPAAIVNAYVKGSFSGAVHALLEPNHAQRFYPSVVENKKIPADFGERVLHCDKACEECGYCRNALGSASVSLL